MDFSKSLKNPLYADYWQGAKRGELRMSFCEACDQAVWYPKAQCPQCASQPQWRSLCGEATLASWTQVHMPVNSLFEPPYIVALVEPVDAPGARVVSQLVACEAADLVCDMPLQAVFLELQPIQGEPFMAPLFTPKA